MPYERQINALKETSDHSEVSSFVHGADMPFYQLTLWPYRSLPRRGFVWFISLTVALICIPLLALLGTKYLWIMLPFLAAAVGAVWYFIERSYKDGTILETLTLWTDKIELTRQNPRGAPQYWSANPYWVSVHMHADTGPVENYITLGGGEREVELGAFLTPSERKRLASELQSALAQLPR